MDGGTDRWSEGKPSIVWARPLISIKNQPPHPNHTRKGGYVEGKTTFTVKLATVSFYKSGCAFMCILYVYAHAYTPGTGMLLSIIDAHMTRI